MARILVSGLINIETTLKVDAFPVSYEACRFPFYGIGSSVSGVGFNLTKALTTLGHAVDFLALVGGDFAGKLVVETLADLGISGAGVLPILETTPQSVILYDGSGKRAINSDLKDIQEQAYPAEQFKAALAASDLALICNVNFARPYLYEAAKLGKMIATDVHAIDDLDDPYNADFMRYADILFMSHENLPLPPEEWVKALQGRYSAEIIALGLGAEGVLLAVRGDNFMERIPAVQTRPVVSSIGAGDALFSAFLHEYLTSRDPYRAMQQAVYFASYKIGVAGAADGFLDAAGLMALYAAAQGAD